MAFLAASLGNLGKTVAASVEGSTKLLADVTGVAMKTAESGVRLSGATIDAGVAISEGAVKAVGDVGVAATGAVGTIGTTALNEAGQVGKTTIEGTSKTIQAGADAVFNTSTRVLKGVDTMTRIAASAGANTAARIETSQAATATGIAARAPEKIRAELLSVFDSQVTKDMRDLLRIAGKTQMANLQLQTGAFKSVYCYGVSGFFRKYFSTHPCPKQRPANTVDRDVQQMNLFTKQLEGKFDMLAKTIRFKLGAVKDAATEYPAIVEEFRTGASSLAEDLANRYAPVIEKYAKLNAQFFEPALAEPTPPAPSPPESAPAVGQGRRKSRRSRKSKRKTSRLLPKERVKRT
jgi:hypothetical protein